MNYPLDTTAIAYENGILTLRVDEGITTLMPGDTITLAGPLMVGASE